MNALEILLEKYPDKRWDWGCISINPNITQDFIKRYPDKPWIINNHKYITQTVNDYLDDYNTIKLSKNDTWAIISQDLNITLNFIEKNIDMPFNWHFISQNPNITIDFIKKYPNVQWNWRNISENKGILMDDIEMNIDMPWDWNWIGISCNPNLTTAFIEKYPDTNRSTNERWNWDFISRNPNINIEYIEKNYAKDDAFKWVIISRSPSITIDFIEKNIDKINWGSLSRNTFEHQNMLLLKHERLLKFTKLHESLIDMILEYKKFYNNRS